MHWAGGCFARVATRRAAGDVVDGLLADLPRNNCWSLAEYAGHDSPDRIQHLLVGRAGTTRRVRAEVSGYLAENLTGEWSRIW